MLWSNDTGYQLSDKGDEHVLGRLRGSGSPIVAEAADGSWVLRVVRKRLGWSIVAEARSSGQIVGGYRPSWLRRGGRVWLFADRSGALRPRSLVSLDPSWKLSLDGVPVARIHRSSAKTPPGIWLEVVIDSAGATLSELSLLVLLGCWAVLLNEVVSTPVPDGSYVGT